MSAHSSSAIEADAMTPGSRVFNFLAIASPYLAGAMLVVFLWLTEVPIPQSVQASEYSLAKSASGPAISVSGDTSDTSTPPPPRSTAAAVQPRPTPLAASAPSSNMRPASVSAALQPVVVDPAVAATMKLSGPAPVYPAVAKAAAVQGTVVVALTIASDGSVSDAHIINGPQLLQATTIAAVRSWQYRPYLILGRPTAFHTQISINFSLTPGWS
jgi:TonB family protein